MSVAESAAQHQVDIHTSAGKLADLRKRTAETLHPAAGAAVEKVHAKGKLMARERIYALLGVSVADLLRHRKAVAGLIAEGPPSRVLVQAGTMHRGDQRAGQSVLGRKLRERMCLRTL